MEDLIISSDELKLLRKYKITLEAHFHVKVNLPVDDVHDSCARDLFCANLSGEFQNISRVKNFIKKKMSELTKKREARCTVLDNVPLITLSDSDSDKTVLVETQNKTRRKKRKRNLHKAPEQVIDLTSVNIEGENICEVSSTTSEADKTIEIHLSPAIEHIPSRRVKNEHVPALDYIPLKCAKADTPKSSQSKDDSVVILSENEDDIKPAVKLRRKLRPIVIDGSNVAREHGKTTRSFSGKGIQLCVEYFLKRGHTQVTAFIPNFRRHASFWHIPTTDEPILEELASKQHVVFTPSRYVNGKRVTCYDDRFIVELASQTGGVILSNDNYKDLLDDSAGFKKTIEERLLMYCFVGDILMIPNDPLGRNGPDLEEYLSMPEEVENPVQAASLLIPSKSQSNANSGPKCSSR